MLKLNIKSLGAAVLAAGMILLAGCSSNSGKAFVTIDGTAYKEEEMYANIYNSIGNSLSGVIEFDESASAKEIKTTIDDLQKDEKYRDYVYKQKIAYIKQKVGDAKLLAIANEQNLTLNEEETATVDKEYNSVVEFFKSEDTITQIKEQMFKDANNPDQEAKRYLEKYKGLYFSLYNVDSFETLKEKFVEQARMNKVLELQGEQVPDDEDYIKKYYTDTVTAQKTAFEQDPSAFETASDNGEVICFYPAGLRYVRHILVEFTEEEQTQLQQYEARQTELEAKENRSNEENAELEQVKTQITTAKAAMDTRAKAKADEAYGKITAGEDFEAVLKAYNSDASMTDSSSPYAEKGYLINDKSNMVEEFLTVAMALKNPGDVGKPVKSTYGYHIIKYMEKGKEGEIPYEQVRDEIITVAMEEKRKEVIMAYYDSLYEEIIRSGKVAIHYDVLGFDKETYDRLYGEIMNPQTGEAQ